MSATRHAGIDALKVVAAQMIVLHHFAWYGPTWHLEAGASAAIADWFAEYGRLAVQVFLVSGGLLAAGSFAGRRALLPAIGDRWRRLVLPMACAVVLAITVSAWVRPWLPEGVVPEPPTWASIGAHLLLVQDLLRRPSLSTGLWYVAIDFHLTMLFLVLMALVRGRAARAAAVVALGAASLLGFNRVSQWDIYAVYFFGSYALGITAHGFRERDGLKWPFLAMLAIAALALAIDWRTRIAVSVAASLVFAAWPAASALDRLPLLARLSRSSYALFLVHFPVFLLVEGVFARHLAGLQAGWAVRLTLAWCLSMIVAELFEPLLVRPAAALLARLGRMRARLARAARGLLGTT